MSAPLELVKYVAENGKLPVVNFAASGIFKSGDPMKRAKAIVQATTHFNNPKILAEASSGLGEAMVGISDIKASAVNFRDREGGNPAHEHKKRKTVAHGDTP